jgi:hypothetical protein
MSKKSRKTRQPNVPMQTGPMPATETKAGGGVIKMQSRSQQSGTETIDADYTHIFSDLRRIVLLAGLIFVGLVVLSFFIK